MRNIRYLDGLRLLAVIPLAIARLSAGPDEKLPITTTSEQARAHFLEGRALAENLRLTDAIQHFQSAVDADQGFALAHLYLAQTAPTAKEFFAHLNKAAELAAHASQGEQLYIKGFQAGAYADPVSQRKAYEELVKAFPGDERAQTLLGISYFGQQDYANAIVHLKKATELSPGFAPAYNQLGYAYRFVNKYTEAEQTFKKYTELLPGDPNPFDSYAELLLKMGRFDEAIAQYRKALGVNPLFANSFAGIAAALMYQGKHGDARAELQKAFDSARNDGEKRAALFGMAVSYMDEGKAAEAQKEIEKQFAIAEAIHDSAAMAGDMTLVGNICLQNGKAGDALSAYKRSLALVENAGLAQEVKENAALIYHYNVGRAAVSKGDLATAETEAQVFLVGVEKKKNANQMRLAHELAGTIALKKKEYARAIEELMQSSQQDPNNLYRLALAYQATGKTKEARAACTRAARFNALPALNYAFVRMKAETLLSAL